MLTGLQIRTARELLGWDTVQLARKATLFPRTIERAERSNGEAVLNPVQAAKARRTLESAGVEFTNGDGPGVKLKAKGSGK
jgi:transcriptional regulator with XRE-family HTH domain